ncbi:amino acid adenylation domain-containing protein [Scytonema sp. NUACC26]|uniref:amino acid adenylation domain-containing protein n=1 Tax=Scytonema sp. NUACC26 TaxID=3140176 RepID=UPI0034DC6ADE
MKRNELLKELDRQGIKLSVKNERLIIEAPKGVLTLELRNSLAEHKLDIMRLLGQTEINTTSLPVIEPDPTRRYEPFPLTDIQQAYWIGRSGIFELGDVAISGYIEFETENLDLSRLSVAWRKLIYRHDMLRAVVLPTGEQQILEEVPDYEISTLDLRKIENLEAERVLAAMREKLSHHMLPCDRWPLFDIQATYLDDNRMRLHIKIDLLMMDAASIQILFQEWNQLYQNPEFSFKPLELSFRDYVINKQIRQEPELIKRSRNYWFSRLDTLPPAPELPLVCFPSELKDYRFKRYRARLEHNIWEQLKQRGKNAGLTPSVILLAAFAAILTAWSKNPRFTINLTVFERLPLHPDIDRIIGDFTNINLLAVDNSTLATFTIRARKIQQQLLQDLDHIHISGVEVLRELVRRRKTGLTAVMPIVFTSLLGLNSVNKRDLELSFLGEEVYSISQTPQVWLDHQVTEQKGALIFNWDVVEELFPKGAVDDMFGAYCDLLQRLATSESAWVEAQQQLLPPTQLSQRHEVNNTNAPICQQTLHGLFTLQVNSQPQQVAVIAPEGNLTYEELYQQASGLAVRLQQLGATPNTLVAVVMDKGWEQVVAVLGILMSGAAYVPIDPSLPQQRQWYLLAQGQVKLVVIQPDLESNLSLPPEVQSLYIDDGDIETLNTTPILHHENNSNLAYVIYTSGSTGLPKGVAIDHRGAVNTIVDINQRFGVGNRDRLLAVSALNFDLSVYDLFGILAAGGTIVIPPPQAVKDPACWYELIVQHGVTLWNSVPALMQMLVEYLSLQPQTTALPLRLALLSGDWLPLSLPAQIQAKCEDIQIVSLGGATEASIWSIYYPIPAVDPNWKSIPYGKPLTNQQFYVLNELMEPTPVWVTGQLYIGGIGLASGYWGDDEKTKACFITHPVTGERLYKTGDLGRYLPSGDIEFLGRSDYQVKINGYRIELGEIEATLKQHPAIQQAVVTAVGEERSQQQLVAYIVGKDPSLSSTEFKLYLQQKLPKYMIPDTFVQLKVLPLTSNGKVDRQALKVPDLDLTQRQFIFSRDTIELQLAQIWSDLLNVTPVGVTDNFFDLGGNSILAIRLTIQIQKQFQKNLPPVTLFQNSTISELAHLLRSSTDSIPWSALVPIQLSGDRLPLFCIHPFGGNVLCYQDLARYLGLKRPIYGLQAVGLNPEYEAHTQIEQMATHYIQELQTVQPRSPYFLCGWSMGSLIAFEIAQQLSSQGEQIALLALLDPFTPSMMSPSIPEEDLALLALGLLGDLNFNLEYLSQLKPDERLIYVIEQAKKNNRVPSDFDLEQVRHLLQISKLNYQAEQNYQPQSYSGKIILFKASETDADLEAAWNELAPHVEMHLVPGNHYNMLQQPHVRTLAQQLQKYLDV